jgi:hypothetical protein
MSSNLLGVGGLSVLVPVAGAVDDQLGDLPVHDVGSEELPRAPGPDVLPALLELEDEPIGRGVGPPPGDGARAGVPAATQGHHVVDALGLLAPQPTSVLHHQADRRVLWSPARPPPDP